MSGKLIDNSFITSNVYDTFLFSLATPAFIWSINCKKIQYFNEQAERFFESLWPSGKPSEFDRLIRNWKDISYSEHHTMWFEFFQQDGSIKPVQVRNSYLDQKRDLIATVVINPTWAVDQQNHQPMSFITRILGSVSSVFCSRTDFIEGFENLLDEIEIESGISEIGFIPSDCFKRFDLYEMIHRINSQKSFFVYIDQITNETKKLESGKLLYVVDFLPEAPETWMIYKIKDETQEIGSFLIVIRSGDSQSQQIIQTILEIFNFHFKELIEKMEMTKSLYQNVFENSLNSIIVDNISEGVIIVNNDFLIVYINQISSKMFGFCPKDVIGHDIDDLIVTREGVREMVSHHFSTEENQDDDETDTIRYFHRRSGETFPCQIEIKKFDFDEKNSYTIFILTDVTETEENRMKSEQLAQRAFLGDFASLLAHEIRNPVNNMNVWIQNIKSLCHEDDEIYKAAHRIEDDCSRVSHLVTNILAYSKPLKLNLEEVDLASFLLDLLERWKINFVRSNIKYYFSPPDNFPKIMGDPRALEQVFNNLIGNAIDAFDNKGGVISLKISLYQPETGGRKALISVSDNGPGIPDDMIDHIFEPFVTSKKKGNGWGLAISKRIVTSHKGSIQVKSYPGGTVFEILLPIINGA
jgi:PAS domain S-box-containing protein